MPYYRIFWRSCYKDDWKDNSDYSSVIRAKDDKDGIKKAERLINRKNNTAMSALKEYKLIALRRIIRKAVAEKSVAVRL